MANSEMGTTSRAEAQRKPGQWMNAEGVILVTTEVRREIVQDPSFPSMGDVSCLGSDASISNGGDGAGNCGGHDVPDVPSLDELPLPDGIGLLS